jgi:hypothetical protein
VKCAALACAAPVLISSAVALGAEPPKCGEAAKLAWYQRAIEVTDGDATPHGTLPEWCWSENRSANRAASRPARAPRKIAAEVPAAVHATPVAGEPAIFDNSLRSVAIRNDALSTGD